MQLKYAFSFAAVAAFLAACDSTVTNINDDAKAEGTITIKVVDNHSGAALSGVTVYSVVDDKAVIADSLGLSVWKNQALGDHSYQISKDGYATVHALVNLAEQGQGDIPRVGDVIQTVPMYKAGVQAKGIVLFTDDKSDNLTTKESELLSLLCAHMNEILERNFALKTIWIDDNYFNARSMDVYITKLRKKLKDDPTIEIINIHGKGYKLIAPEVNPEEN